MIQRETQEIVERRFNLMILISILVEVLLIIFGIVMLFDPNFSNKFMGVILGILFLLYAGSLIFNFFTRDGAKLYSLNIAFSVIVGIIGILLIVYPYALINFVITCLGIYIIISGAVKINYSLWLKKGQEESWYVVLANGIMLVILGILINANPFANMLITRIIGIFIIVSSVLKMSDTILFRKRSKEIMKIFW